MSPAHRNSDLAQTDPGHPKDDPEKRNSKNNSVNGITAKTKISMFLLILLQKFLYFINIDILEYFEIFTNIFINIDIFIKIFIFK